LGGACPHECSYCYVDNPRSGRPTKYTGAPRLLENELQTKYGKDKIIFVENCNDLFAEGIPEEFISRVIGHCVAWPENTYVFQTKNPARLLSLSHGLIFPDMYMVGTTIETNRNEILAKISTAPPPNERFEAMCKIDKPKFVTVEPILDFDVDILATWLIYLKSEKHDYFVNIGADSKRKNLEEPSAEKILALVLKLQESGVEIRKKHNLGRLLDHHPQL
jgi:DNA repair photolyase